MSRRADARAAARATTAPTPLPAPVEATPEPPAAPEATARGVLRALSVIAPATLITALAYYFGWTATHASATYLGIDESLLAFSTQDYLLRSIVPLALPLCIGLILAALALRGHTVVSSWRLDPPGRRRVTILAVVLTVVGLVMATYGVLALVNRWIVGGFSVAPLCVTIGVALVSYAVVLRNRLAPASAPAAPGGAPSLTVVLISLLIAVGLFWEVAEWATAVGIGTTRALVANLAAQPNVTVFSAKQLALAGSGVTETPINEKDGAYHFRYTGLRLLFRANDRYFLLSDPWSRSRGVLFVLDDTPDIRLEFAPGRA